MPTIMDTIAMLTGNALPPSSSSTTARRRSTGNARSDNAERRLSLASKVRANRNISSSVSDESPSAAAISRIILAYASMRPSLGMSVAPDARDVAVDQLLLRGLVEVALDDLAGELDRHRGHLALEIDPDPIDLELGVLLCLVADRLGIGVR